MKSARSVLGAVVGVSLALTAGCGSSGTTKSSSPAQPAAGGGASSSAPADGSATSPAAAPAAGGALTADQLKSALLADSDVPGYAVDDSADGGDVKTEQQKVTAGGAVCQKFMDANDALVSAYGTVAQVDHGWKDEAKALDVQLSLMAYPSADKAKVVVADVKTAAAGCKQLSSGDGADAGTMAVTPLPDIKVGDSSTVFLATMKISALTINELVATVQVGSSTFSVAIGGPGLDKGAVNGKVAELKGYAGKQAAKLQAAQKH